MFLRRLLSSLFGDFDSFSWWYSLQLMLVQLKFQRLDSSLNRTFLLLFFLFLFCSSVVHDIEEVAGLSLVSNI